jgi:predicted RNA-binding protein with PUA domain
MRKKEWQDVEYQRPDYNERKVCESCESVMNGKGWRVCPNCGNKIKESHLPQDAPVRPVMDDGVDNNYEKTPRVGRTRSLI